MIASSLTSPPNLTGFFASLLIHTFHSLIDSPQNTTFHALGEPIYVNEADESIENQSDKCMWKDNEKGDIQGNNTHSRIGKLSHYSFCSCFNVA